MCTNKKIYLGILLACIANFLNAQGAYDLLYLSNLQPQGTARYMGMAGAFYAVGGDLSSLGTNPAGIGLFRSSQLVFTPSMLVDHVETKYMENTTRETTNSTGVSNVGFVGTIPTGQNSGLVAINLGISYNKMTDFNRRSYAMGSTYDIHSVMYEYAYWANQGFRADMIEGAIANGLISINEQGEYTYSPTLETGDDIEQHRITEQNGNIGEYLFSIGGNYNHKLYFGFTLGVRDLNLERVIQYNEIASDLFAYNYGDLLEARRKEIIYSKGAGVNAKFGLIYRITNQLRIGATYHTPTIYSMEHKYQVYMEAAYNSDPIYYTPVFPFLRDWDYRMKTPHRIGLGLAYTLSSKSILSFDYEMVAYNKLRMINGAEPGYVDATNLIIKNLTRNTSTYRFGAEFKIGYGLMLRGGFSYTQSFFRERFNSNFDNYLYAGGIGYRIGGFILDFSYNKSTGSYSYIPSAVYETRVARDDINGAHERQVKDGYTLSMGFKF